MRVGEIKKRLSDQGDTGAKKKITKRKIWPFGEESIQH
jgi:hypothetical protein